MGAIFAFMAFDAKDFINSGVGVINKDISPLQTNEVGTPVFNAQNYTDGLNIRPLSDSDGNTLGKNAVVGNTYIATIGLVSSSDKVYRIYAEDYSINTDLNLTIFNSDGVTPILGPITTTLPSPVAYSDILDWVFLAISTDPNFTVSPYVSGDSYVEFYYSAASQEYFTLFTINDAPGDVRIMSEYIPAAYDGKPMVPVSSVWVGNYLFILSASGLIDEVGEIGVVSNTNINEYAYTRLLRSKDLLLNWAHLPDLVGEVTPSLTRLYFTDGIHKDRVFYYRGSYQQDGALWINNTSNFYRYGDIQTQLLQEKFPNDATISYSDQDQIGGNLAAGTYYYTISLIDFNGVGTEYLPLTNPINVFIPDTGSNPLLLCGSQQGDITSKANVLSIDNVNPVVFPFVDLICCYEGNGVFSSYKVKRVSTQSGPFDITHTGFEVTESIASAELSLQGLDILNSRNNRILYNRYVKSNINIRDIYDFSDASSNLVLSTVVQERDSEGAYIDTTGNGGQFGAYFDPNNECDYLGYMDNETYRFGIVVHWLDGTFTNAFYVNDITVSTPDVSLTTTYATGSNIRIRAVRVSGWVNFWAAIPGDIISQISHVEIVRCACIPEVLATGMIHSLAFGGSSGGNNYYFNYIGDRTSTGNKYNNTYLHDYQTFISPDVLLGGANLEYLSGDYIKYVEDVESIGGTAFLLSAGDTANGDSYRYTQSGGGGTNYSSLLQYSGNTSSTFVDIDILGVTNLSTNNNTVFSAVDPFQSSDNITLSAGNILSKNQLTFGPATYFYNKIINQNKLLSLDTAGAIPTIAWSKYAQYIRPRTNKYGDPYNGDNVYYPVNSFQLVNETANLDCFGGDTFIQKSVFRVGEMLDYTANENESLAFSFYSQNKINANMRYNRTGGWKFPFNLDESISWANRVGQWLEQGADEGFEYDSCYTPFSQRVYVSYNSDWYNESSQGTRIRWSLERPVGTNEDNYCKFLSLNFADLDPNDGKINHMEVANGELVTWQDRKFMRQYFLNTGLTTVSGQNDILVGDGSILGRRGQSISQYGTTHKFSVIKGISNGGKDTLMWIDTKMKKLIRFGYDGTVTISDDIGFRSFFNDYFRVADLRDSSANQWGETIYGVWDEAHKEYIYSVNARRYDYTWNNTDVFTKGQTVLYTGAGYTTFEKTGEIFKAKSTVPVNTPPTLSGIDPYWDFVVHDNSLYYSEFTFAFNEVLNGISTFYSFKPRLFMRYNNVFMSASPVIRNDSGAYLYTSDLFIYDNQGDVCTWFKGRPFLEGSNPALVAGSINAVWASASSTLPNFDTVNYLLRIEHTLGDYTYYAVEDVQANSIRIYPAAESSIVLSTSAILCQQSPSYREDLVNLMPEYEKRYLSLLFDSSTEPLKTEIVSSVGQQTYLTSRNANNSNLSDYQEREVDGRYLGAIHDDIGSFTGNNMIDGDRIYGRFIKVKTYFRAFQNNVFRDLLTRLRAMSTKIRPQ